METFLPGVGGRRVPGDGPRGSKILFLAEAPGRDEAREGIPLVGATGQLLFRELERFGVGRSDVRLENVREVRPLDNDLFTVSDVALRRDQEGTHRRLARCTPNVIVAFGNFALNTLRRKGWKRKARERRLEWDDKITNWRGSITSYRGEDGRVVKVVPMIHPATIFRQPKVIELWRADLARAVAEAAHPDLRLWPVGEHIVEPTAGDGEQLVRAVEAGAPVALDIETPGRWLSCVGACIDGKVTVTIGVRPEHWGGDPSKVHRAYGWIGRILRSRADKTFHHGLFDNYVLTRQKGMKARRWWWDTMLMHHALEPVDRHSLAYCASRDLRVEFWKDEAKEEEDGHYTREWSRDWRKLFAYNGKDVLYTWHLQRIYQERLEAEGWLDYYHDHYRRLAWACLALSLTGIRCDRSRMQNRRALEEGKLAVLAAQLSQLAGRPVVGKGGGLSAKEVMGYFYGTLGLKAYRKRDTGNPTADELAIRRLVRRVKKARPFGELALTYRRRQKVREMLDPKQLDDDDRLRGLFKPTPVTGRLACAKNPLGTGNNAQNRDREIRDVFIAG